MLNCNDCADCYEAYGALLQRESNQALSSRTGQGRAGLSRAGQEHHVHDQVRLRQPQCAVDDVCWRDGGSAYLRRISAPAWLLFGHGLGSKMCLHENASVSVDTDLSIIKAGLQFLVNNRSRLDPHTNCINLES